MKQEQQFTEVVQLIQRSRTNAYKAINTELINCYWQVGEHISQRIANAIWGDKTIDELANFIGSRHPDLKGYTRSSLYRMRKFYETYRNISSIVAPVVRQLQDIDSQKLEIVAPLAPPFQTTNIRDSILTRISWTNHLIILARTKTIEEKEFYIRLSIRENYGKRELDRQISSGTFERVMLGNQQLPAKVRNIKQDISGAFKSDYILEFLNLPADHNEGDLQKALVGQMKNFILELGRDFLFMGEEYRIQVGNSDFKTDLLFFHRGLQCLVVLELKADKFRPEYLGQLDFYLEALDQDVKKDHENPSIGILLCKDQDTEVVKYALNRSLSPALVAAKGNTVPLAEGPSLEVLRHKAKFQIAFGANLPDSIARQKHLTKEMA
ncbi:MAG TPA: PDDEXK nuclease domain-containing protein [Puia sp.]|nr:PDDEXK nuclease domain-containing protein [Puia sp.]